MNQENIKPSLSSRPGLFGSLNPQKILVLILNHWYVYVIALLVSYGGGYLYLKYKIPKHFVSNTILIEEENPMPGEDLLQGFAVRPGVQNLDNQLIIVTSYSLIRKTINQLNFEIDMYRKGFMSQLSYYPLFPLRIEAGQEGLPYNTELLFRYIENEKFHLSSVGNNGPELDTVMAFGQLIHYGSGSFTIYPEIEAEEVYKSGEKIYLKFSDNEALTASYIKRLKVDLAAREGSIVQLSLEGTNRIKDVVFLNKLGEVYINDNLEKKNAEADRIIDFIDAQLVDVTESLEITENQLQEFRSRNRIMDVSAQAQQIIDQAVLLENEKATLTIKKEYYQYLDDYLASDRNDEAPIAPSSMGIDDPLITDRMQEFAGLQAEYFSGGAGELNPLQGQLVNRIRNTKKSIRETLSSIIQANEMSIRENESQINRLNAEASSLPEKERQLLGFERRFNLNNVLYTYLLQERAEAQIQSASNTPDNVLVDPARSAGIISPLWQVVVLFAFALAIGLPTLVIILANVLQNKIATEDDLHFVKDFPILGHFPHSRLSYNTVVLTEPNSRISEAFRSLRTRLDFFTTDVHCPILLITSSMPGEGKSFAAINLASAYSMAGKKTLLVGFDLRKPTVSKSFKLDSDIGITSYLIGKNTLDEAIHETDFENFYILPSGPIPPNPGELASSPKAIEMIQKLQKKFDYIVVDSAPIGVVSDIYPVAKHANAVLIMVRHSHTKKNVLSATLSELQLHGLRGMSLLLNDISAKVGSYRYAYKYKYEYDSSTTKVGLFKKRT